VLLRALKGKSEGEDLTKDEGDELGTARAILETSSTALCATFMNSLTNNLDSSELAII
jgi:hypothetical protein